MGISNTINENHFDKQQTAQYKLSILLGVDSFFYAVSSGSNELLVVKAVQLPATPQPENRATAFKEFYQREELLKLPYRQVKIGLFSATTTLVPQRLFNASKLKEYLAPVAEVAQHESAYHDELPTLDLTNIYATDTTWHDTLQRQFEYCKIYHQSTVLLRSFQRRQRGKTGYSLYAHVSSRTIQLFLYDGANLIFSNTFYYQSTKDFVYYALLVYDQFSLSPTELPLQLSGQILKESELYRLLYRYIKTIQFIDVRDLVKVGENFQRSALPHQYYDLASLVVY